MENLIIVSILIPLFQAMTNNDNLAFRTVCLVPAALVFAIGALMYRYADDTPRGNYKDLKKDDPALASKRPLDCFWVALQNRNAWILSIQYACCFGLELILNSVAVLYFEEEFGLAPEAAAAIGNIFGWLEFFARPLGGIASDLANARSGMRGRLSVQAGTLLFEGAFTLIFASCYTLGGSVSVLVFFSLFVKAAKGSTFAVVPYASPLHMGSVMGLTSSGGVIGALAFDAVCRSFEYRQALIWTGVIVILCSFLTALISIDGHRGLFTGIDRNVDPETGIVRCSRGSKASGSSHAGSSHAGSDRRPDERPPDSVRSA
jgi:MFS transporter, NNP family, nitrate/nitrite transporter